MIVKPSKSWVAVVLDNPPEKSPGGIYLPDAAREHFVGALIGTVMAVGPDVLDYQPDDRVLLSGLDGHPCRVGEQEFRMVKDEDLLAHLDTKGS